MRWRTQSLIAGGLLVASAAPALACNFWFNSSFLQVPAKAMVSAGLQNWDNYRIIAVDAAIRATDKVVVRPGFGQCSYTGPGESESNAVFGAAVGANVWKDAAGKVAVNAQAAFEMNSFDGGSERNIPIGAALQYMASEMFSIFGGASMNLYNISYDEAPSSFDGSSNDVSIFAGAAFTSGNFQVTGGITSWDGETAINVGAGMSLGGASNAIRRIGSLFRK